MTGFHITRFSILISLVFLLGLIPQALWAQEVTKGSIINSITLTETPEGDHILTIQGVLNTSALNQVRIKQKIKENKMSISLPGSLVDPDGISNPILTFGEGAPIENLQLSERIQEKEDQEITFVLDLDILTKKTLRAQILKPISAESIQIKLVDYEKAVGKSDLPSTPGTLALKQAREQQQEFNAKRQRELEEQKRLAMEKAQSDVQTILKSYNKPLVMRVAIINGSGVRKSAYQLSVYLNSVQKQRIEKDLGLKLNIANIANAKMKNINETTIFYRENYLKPALSLAHLIQGYQKLVPMKKDQEKVGVDVEIYLGNDYQ